LATGENVSVAYLTPKLTITIAMYPYEKLFTLSNANNLFCVFGSFCWSQFCCYKGISDIATIALQKTHITGLRA